MDYADGDGVIVMPAGRGPNPWVTVGSIIISLVLVVGFFILTSHGHGSSLPGVRIDDSVAIRTAQVRLFRAQAAVQEKVPELNAANAALSDAVNKALVHAGVDPTKFNVDEKDGALVIVPKAQASTTGAATTSSK